MRKIGADQDAQRDRSLQLGLARLVGVLRIGAVRAAGERRTGSINAGRPADTCVIAWGSTDRIVGTGADGVAAGRAGGIISFRHPGDADIDDWRQNARRRRIENCRRNGKLRILIARKRRFQELKGRPRRKVALRGRQQVVAAATPSSSDFPIGRAGVAASIFSMAVPLRMSARS